MAGLAGDRMVAVMEGEMSLDAVECTVEGAPAAAEWARNYRLTLGAGMDLMALGPERWPVLPSQCRSFLLHQNYHYCNLGRLMVLLDTGQELFAAYGPAKNTQ